MNELLFFIHFAAIAAFLFIALKTGKHALFTLLIMSVILGNLFVLKEITLFGLTVTATEPFTITSMVALGIMHEFHGDKTATQGLSIMLLTLSFLTIMSYLQILYTPSPVDQFHSHYEALLSPSPRILLSSIFVAVSMQALNLGLLKFSKKSLPKVPFAIRQTVILLAVQLIDTICFSFCALYGIMHNLTHIIVMSYAIKVITIGAMSPLLGLIKRADVQSPS